MPEAQNRNSARERYASLIDTQSAAMRRWEELFIRYMTIANAGGVIAILSFLGVTWDQTYPKWPALVPLLSFILGIVFSGLSLLYPYFHYKHIIESQHKALPKSDIVVTVGGSIWLFDMPGPIIRLCVSWSYKAAIAFLSFGLASGSIVLVVILSGVVTM